MIWISRVIGLVNGGFMGYWCNFHSSPNYPLFLKFILVSTLGFSAGYWFLAAKNGKQSR